MTKIVHATHFRHPTDEHLCCRTWKYSGSSLEWTPLGSKKGVRNLSWPLTVFCEFKAAVSRAVCLRECALGELPLTAIISNGWM